jgi:hypothetical protein
MTVGNSTRGNGDTGNFENPRTPASVMASVSNVVATGRTINGAEIFMHLSRSRRH